MTLYEGNIFGFNYYIEFETDIEFQEWLEAKLLRYLLNPDNPATPVIIKILGITDIKERIDKVELKQKEIITDD